MRKRDLRLRRNGDIVVVDVGEKEENKETGISEEDSVVTTKASNAKIARTDEIGSLGSDITSTTSGENWITVRTRTRQVRTQGDVREPSNVKAKKPMGNNAAKKNERSSHSIV